MMAGNPWTFCDQILPDVSRSFALIIPQCPPPIDQALCAAYLICRLADTVEDEASLSGPQRERLYDALLTAVDAPGEAARVDAFIRAWPEIPAGHYGRLICGTGSVLAAFASLPPDFQKPIRTCVHDMVAGMRQTAPVEIRNGVSYLCRDLAELDRYCHFVAGTVGIMSTALFAMRFDPGVFLATDEWREQGRRMGLGLQMTNIVKDCRLDARRGVSFIPSRYVDAGGPGGYSLRPEGRGQLIRHTIEHLDAAMHYVAAVPVNETGIRTFLLGSLLPAIATLEVAAPGDQFQPKISRGQMSEILAVIADRVSDDAALDAWYQAHRGRATEMLSRSE